MGRQAFFRVPSPKTAEAAGVLRIEATKVAAKMGNKYFMDAKYE